MAANLNESFIITVKKNKSRMNFVKFIVKADIWKKLRIKRESRLNEIKSLAYNSGDCNIVRRVNT